jgi:DNA repair protein RadC
MKTNNIAEIQISYSPTIKKQFRIKITNSTNAYESLINTWNKNIIELQEEFKIILLNNANEILGIHNLCKGSTSGVNVDLKLLFAVVLKSCATSIIVAHNHPSGKLMPSESDIAITKKIKRAGELLDIKLLDHLIVTKDGFYSMVDNNNF